MTSRTEADYEGHLAVLHSIVARYGAELHVTFSRYEVGPPGDQQGRRRTAVQVKAGDVTRGWMHREIATLRSDEELALHSRVSAGGESMHIIMVDYEPSCALPQVRQLGVRVLRNAEFRPSSSRSSLPGLYTFESGRAYHQYSDVLVEDSRWHQHLATLLLLNSPGEPSVVDARWIGHALRRGYAALRWTQNTSRYTSIPRCIDRTSVGTRLASDDVPV